MKLEEYVRTPKGIGKIKTIEEDKSEIHFNCDSGLSIGFVKRGFTQEEIANMYKHSHKIEDLLRIGDYVNGYMITDFSNEYYDEELDDYVEGFSIVLGNEEQQYSIPPKDIKTVATKEQMEAIQYKVV